MANCITNFRIIRSFFIIFSLFLSISTFAQHSITGKIINKDNNSIEAANIQLLQSDSVFISGMVSDAGGLFEMKNLKSGEYILVVSHIEYQKQYQKIAVSTQNISLGNIILFQEAKMLDDIQIVADRIIRKKDGMLIYPRKNELKFAGSGYDVLYNIMIPGVNVDRSKGLVTRLGQEVALYVDGQKVGYREIQNIESASIDRIEYIDVPSGKYIQDNTAINIITKKKTSGSYFSLDAKQNIGYLKGDYNATAQFSKENLSFQAFGGYNMEDYDNPGSTITENYNLPERTVSRYNKILRDVTKNNNQYVQLNLKSSTPKKTLVAKFSFVRSITPDNYTDKEIDYLNLDAKNIKSNSFVDEKNYKPTMELYGNFELPRKQNLSVTLGGSYNKNKYVRDYKETDFSTHTEADEDFYNTKLNLNYSKKVKNNNTFSASIIENYRLSDSQYTGSSNYSQELYTNEAILRLGYMHHFGNKWILNSQLGASWLNYELKGEEGRNQFTPRANVMLRYMPFQKQAFTFSFNAGNSFPTVNSLNTVDQAINSILVKRGNPDLDMSKLYNGSLMYNLFSKKLSIQAMLIGNVFTNLAVPYYFAEKDKIISTFKSNIDLHQHIGVLSGTWNISSNFDLKSELAVLHYQFKGSFREEQTTFRAMADLNYSWKNIMVNLSVKAKEKRLTNSAVYEEDFIQYGGNIRWSVPNWHVELGTTNPFSRHNNICESYDGSAYSYLNTTLNKSFQSVGYVKLVYKFSRGKKQKVENGKVDTNTESAIMKVK